METTTTTTAKQSQNVNTYAKKARPGVLALARKCGNPLRYGACVQGLFERNAKENSYGSYEPCTTFASDFAIAELFGDDAILDTYRRSIKGWLSDYKYATELAMVLNHLCWFWYYQKEIELSKLYQDLYYDCRNKFYDLNEIAEDDDEQTQEKKREAVAFFFDATD